MLRVLMPAPAEWLLTSSKLSSRDPELWSRYTAGRRAAGTRRHALWVELSESDWRAVLGWLVAETRALYGLTPAQRGRHRETALRGGDLAIDRITAALGPSAVGRG